MARSIYQGSAAAVCQARELSARRARGLEKKATGSFLLSLLLFFSLSSPRFRPLFSSPSYVHILNPSLARPLLLPLLPFSLSPSFSPSLFIPCYFPLFCCFWVIFHRCSGRQKRRDGGGGVAADTHTKTSVGVRASARPHRGDGAPIHAIPRTHSAHDCRIYRRDALKNLTEKRNAWLRRVHVPSLILLPTKTSRISLRGDPTNVTYYPF